MASASSTAIASSTASGANSTAESANAHQIRIRRAAAGAEALEHLVARPAQDVGVVEALRQQRERDVEQNRDGDQHEPGDRLLAHDRLPGHKPADEPAHDCAHLRRQREVGGKAHHDAEGQAGHGADRDRHPTLVPPVFGLRS